MKITNKASGFGWDEKRSWLVNGALAEKTHQWEEEATLARRRNRGTQKDGVVLGRWER
jgi:hypothetical protein